MRRLLKYIKHYKVQAILAPLFKMLEATFELFVPLVMARLIDVGIAGEDTGYIAKCGVILIALALIGYVTAITAQYFAAKAAMGFGLELRHDLFRHIMEFSYTEIDGMGTSSLITRMTSDVNQIQTGVNMILRLFLRSPFIVAGAVIMAFTVDVKSALIFLVVLPLLVVVVFSIVMSTVPKYRDVQKGLDRVTLLTRESLSGARVIRAFNRQEREVEDFDTAADELMDTQLGVGKISALMNPVTYVIVNVGTAVLIYYGAIRVNTGNLTQGEVVALVNYMSQILIELIKLANLIVTTTKAMACADRVADVLEAETTMKFADSETDSIQQTAYEGTKAGGADGRIEVKSGKKKSRKARKAERLAMEACSSRESAGKNSSAAGSSGGKNRKSSVPAVEFRDVAFSYADSPEHAVEGITFTAKRGDTIGIIGGTGSGKSTVINMIPRFYDATEGSVLIDGVDVRRYGKDELRQKIAIVPQKSVLFKGSIAENIRWGKPDATDEEIAEAIRTAQAEEFVSSKEGTVNYMIDQGAHNLSGGQKQRLCIARALVRRPEILILDDSSSALDYATDSALRRALREKLGGTTVFMISQRTSTISHADQIIVMDDGRVAGIGTHDELLRDCELYREIYDSQNREVTA